MKINGIQDVQCETCHIYLLSSKSQSLNENHNCEDFKQKLADHGIKTISSDSEVQCPHCDLTFSTKKGKGHQIHRHIRSEHGGRAALTYRSSKVEGLHTHQCRTCKIWFTGPVRPDRHQCNEYRKFYEKYILKNDEGDVSEDEDGDDDANKTAKSENLSISQRTKGTTIVTCPYCPKGDTFEGTSGDMYNHVKKVHGRDKWIEYRRTKIPGVREFQCDKCKIYLTANRNHECIVDKVQQLQETTESGISTENRVSTEISTGESPLISSDSGQYDPLGDLALGGTRSWRKDRKRGRKDSKSGRKDGKNQIVVQEEKIIEDFIKCFVCYAQMRDHKAFTRHLLAKHTLRLAFKSASDWLLSLKKLLAKTGLKSL